MHRKNLEKFLPDYRPHKQQHQNTPYLGGDTPSNSCRDQVQDRFFTNVRDNLHFYLIENQDIKIFFKNICKNDIWIRKLYYLCFLNQK